MTDPLPENLVLTLLREMRAEMNARFDAADRRFAKIESNIGLLADGLLSLRKDMQTMRDDIQTISLAVAGHAERLADVETTLELIQRHFNISRPE